MRFRHAKEIQRKTAARIERPFLIFKPLERDDDSSRSSAVALSRSGTVFTSISPRARASESARGSATREATLRCGEPMQLRRARCNFGEPVQLQLRVRIFCLQ